MKESSFETFNNVAGVGRKAVELAIKESELGPEELIRKTKEVFDRAE